MPWRALAADLYDRFVRLVGRPVRHRDAFAREVEYVFRRHQEIERRQRAVDEATPRTPRRAPATPRTPRRAPATSLALTYVPPIGEGRVTWLRPRDPPTARSGAASGSG